MGELYLGVDVGTSSTKGVLVAADGTLLGQAQREHRVLTPREGYFEMDPQIWWDEFCSICAELLPRKADQVAGVGVSGMGPCVGIADENFKPLRPAILYGVDSRATAEIGQLNDEFGADSIFERCSSYLSTQAVGPKLRWLARNEPENFAAARHLFMPASWLVHQLTGEYVLDHQSASQSDPLYSVKERAWLPDWAAAIAGNITLPRLTWADDVAGEVDARAAAQTGLPVGIPVITGTIDAWAEGISANAANAGDLMLMYGTTLFMVCTTTKPVSHPSLWGTVGALPDTYNLAAGMATSGAITNWLRDLFVTDDFAELTEQARRSGVGANGLLMLPYFAGERTPISDPLARGVIAGLTLGHTRGDLYRAALEGTAFGVAHNVAELEKSGIEINRVIAVGGGTKGELWTDIVSSVLGREQFVPEFAIGASYGDAYLAARLHHQVDIGRWNPPGRISRPDPEQHAYYRELYPRYRELYENTKEVAHFLAAAQR